jgi:uncharacterized membrane protein
MMNKQAFLVRLRKALSGLNPKEQEERIIFYSEMIDDRMEEGFSEEEAVTSLGTWESILADLPPAKEKRQSNALVILLLILGCPIWLSFGIAAFSVALSLYLSVWSVIISLWAVFVSLAGCVLGGIIGGSILIFCAKPLTGIAMLATAAVCTGLSIFAFFGCKAATKSMIQLTRKMAIGLKNHFRKKEGMKL